MPPRSVLATLLPATSKSSLFDPVRFSMLISRSPAASPKSSPCSNAGTAVAEGDAAENTGGERGNDAVDSRGGGVDDGVIAAAASVQSVGEAVAGEGVVSCRADDVLDVAQGVGQEANRPLSGQQRHRNRPGNAGVADGIDALTATERVAATEALKGVTLPLPPVSWLAPVLPTRKSLLFEPIRFSMLTSRSPAASPVVAPFRTPAPLSPKVMPPKVPAVSEATMPSVPEMPA